jgi:hypothetical protein
MSFSNDSILSFCFDFALILKVFEGLREATEQLLAANDKALMHKLDR